MMRAAALNFLLIVSGASLAHAQDTESQPQSLGDVARRTRAAKSTAPKSATVLDDDNLPKSKGGAVGGSAGGGTLSGDKQAFCDEVRRRKDSAAEQICAALAIDMSPEYEEVFARYIELAKNLCAANGRHLPNSEPKDPTQSAQWHEIMTVSQKFSGVMKPEKELLMEAEKGSDLIRQQEYSELDKSVPGWRNPGAFAANPQGKQRYDEITAEYNARVEAHDTAALNEKARGRRFIVDMMRLRETCTPH
jgi:hypothetical protein